MAPSATLSDLEERFECSAFKSASARSYCPSSLKMATRQRTVTLSGFSLQSTKHQARKERCDAELHLPPGLEQHSHATLQEGALYTCRT